jgi:hypothetical protein
MKTSEQKQSKLPDFTGKVVSVSIAFEDDGRCLEHPRWETQGGRLFLVGTVPRGASTNGWCDGIPGAVAWDQVTDYMVFDSAEHYRERTGIYERKQRKR